MRPTLTVLCLVIILLGSCMRTSNYDKLFSTADSLMDTRPDSALYILEGMGDTNSFNKRDRMRWMLLLAKAQNKAYVTMPDDSIFEEVVEYYDKNGTPNDQVLAHYLHGCISRDLGDAPRALERYMEAVTCADTTASDCDHATLMGVYGQMADLFYKQGLPEEEARALGLSGEHALKAHNVRNYIRCVELLVRPYYELDDTAAVFETTQRARDLYLRHKLKKEAASVFPTAIYLRLKQGRYAEARTMMDEFERHSGLFVDGEIESSRSGYESSRGMYFEGVHQLDSAEFHYRKALAYGHPFGAYRGLLSIYSTLGITDSVRKYAPLYVKSVDEAAAEQRTKAVLETKALYDYTHSKEEAERERRKAEDLRSKMLGLLVAAGIAAVLSVWFYRSYKRRKEMEIARLADAYDATKERLADNEQELAELRVGKLALESAKRKAEMLLGKENGRESGVGAAVEERLTDSISSLINELSVIVERRDALLAMKEDELERLAAKDTEYEERLKKLTGGKTLAALDGSTIVSVFKKMASDGSKGRKPNKQDWDGLYKAFMLHVPAFYLDLRDAHGLSELELRTALLECIGVKSGGISRVLGKSSQHVTNLKASVNMKMFGDGKAGQLRSNLKRRIDMLHKPSP